MKIISNTLDFTIRDDQALRVAHMKPSEHEPRKALITFPNCPGALVVVTQAEIERLINELTIILYAVQDQALSDV